MANSMIALSFTISLAKLTRRFDVQGMQSRERIASAERSLPRARFELQPPFHMPSVRGSALGEQQIATMSIRESYSPAIMV
jgi:hypothetical protein